MSKLAVSICENGRTLPDINVEVTCTTLASYYDLVTPSGFCPIKGQICALDHIFNTLSGAKTRNTDRDREQKIHLAGGDSKVPGTLAKPFGDSDRLGLVGAHQHQQKLLPPNARNIVHRAHNPTGEPAKLAQHPITGFVAEAIVNRFEVIEITVQKR
ncbi:MAG: hypothetical protein OES38_10285, partial [Gammaproteobacteria bacterium]|nr:hypothetical protein [Gammaproteobacteria bacterium]